MAYTITRRDGGVTSPRGFRAAGLHCGIKASGKHDLALVVSDRPAAAAAVFTTNQAQAAPVLVSMSHLASTSGRARAIITNSGQSMSPAIDGVSSFASDGPWCIDVHHSTE